MSSIRLAVLENKLFKYLQYMPSWKNLVLMKLHMQFELNGIIAVAMVLVKVSM